MKSSTASFSRSIFIGAHLLMMASLFPNITWGQWLANGTPVCTSQNGQHLPTGIPDGEGGAILCWTDDRNGTADIYAQRLNSGGTPMWAASGILICGSQGAQYGHAITSDGEGGAVISWADERSGSSSDIYAQRVSYLGIASWVENGVPVCIALGSQSEPTMTSDGALGAIIAWQDERTGGGSDDIFVQRVDASGNVSWQMNGVSVCAAPYNQGGPKIISDSFGGTIVVWRDVRSGIEMDLFAQRINEVGATCWDLDGVAVCNVGGDQLLPSMVTDDAGGAIVAWLDWRAGFHSDVYGQRIYSTGLMAWNSGGIPVCSTIDDQFAPDIVADGVGGAIVVWDDGRGSGSGVYAQRISRTGSILWTLNGSTVWDGIGDQHTASVVSDGAGGAIAVWQNGFFGSADLYAGRITSSAATPWAPGGVPICTAVGEQSSAEVVSDGGGGVIVTWEDNRNGNPSNKDIYALRVGPEGDIPSSVGGPLNAPSIILHSSPNPFSTRTTIQFELEIGSAGDLEVYDVGGHRVRSLLRGFITAGAQEVEFDGRDDRGRLLPSGVYFCSLVTSTTSATQKLLITR